MEARGRAAPSGWFDVRYVGSSELTEEALRRADWQRIPVDRAVALAREEMDASPEDMTPVIAFADDLTFLDGSFIGAVNDKLRQILPDLSVRFYLAWYDLTFASGQRRRVPFTFYSELAC